jgi:hypothetical protein
MLKEELQKRDAEAGNQQDQLAKMIAEMESSFKGANNVESKIKDFANETQKERFKKERER